MLLLFTLKGQKMSVLLFYNFKGGVGKTTISVLAADHFSKSGKKVLLIDLDAQASATLFFKNSYGNIVPKRSLYTSLQKESLRPSICHLDSNLDLIPGDWDMSLWNESSYLFHIFHFFRQSFSFGVFAEIHLIYLSELLGMKCHITVAIVFSPLPIFFALNNKSFWTPLNYLFLFVFRNCTDVLCCMIFILFIIGYILLGLVGE